MAQAIATNMAQTHGVESHYRFDSAGLRPEDETKEEAVTAIMSLDMDPKSIEGRACKDLADVIKERKWNLALVMTGRMKGEVKRFTHPDIKVMTLMEFAGESGDVADPVGGNDDDYLRVAREIKRLLEKGWENPP